MYHQLTRSSGFTQTTNWIANKASEVNEWDALSSDQLTQTIHQQTDDIEMVSMSLCIHTHRTHSVTITKNASDQSIRF